MTQFNTMSKSSPRHNGTRNARLTSSHSPSRTSIARTSRNMGNEPTLLSRRQLLYGALGVGAVAAVGVGVATCSSQNSGNETVPYLKVPSSAVTTLSEFEALETYDDKVHVVAELELPYGSLVWMNDDAVAACLLPTESAAPLSQVALLHLGSASSTTALEQAVGSDDHFDIYDVRATSEGLIWTEANVLEGAWRIYAAPTSGGTDVAPTLLEEGDSTYETPTIAAVGGRVFWQVLPKDPNPDKLTSRLMAATIGKNDAACVYESARRMGTPIYAGQDDVTITPRLDTSTVYYQLTNINAATGSVTEQITLPSAMTPLEAGFGATGLMFSFPDIYNYGDGISNLGTYVPMSKPAGSYDDAKWFSFPRTPTAPPCWCNNTLIAKSTRAVCGISLEDRTYYAIDVDDGADSYGEYLATTGCHDTFVTYTNVDHTPVEGKATHVCRVKVYTTDA